MGEFAEILAPSRKGFHIVDQSKYNSPDRNIDFSAGTRGTAAHREGFLWVKRKINKIVYFQHNYDDINFGISVSDFRKISDHLMKVVGK